MNLTAFVIGVLVVAFWVIVGWAFHRKPRKYIPETLIGTILYVVFVPFFIVAFSEIFTPSAVHDDAWLLSNAFGRRTPPAPTAPKVIEKSEDTNAPAKNLEPTGLVEDYQPIEHYEQPPGRSTSEKRK